ncbi:MAG: hypothetical protein LBL98_02325 [Ruminococcus sp.]|jgi:hypothetical protein|nr:hypothetical protein [Ruminococcus sp.]
MSRYYKKDLVKIMSALEILFDNFIQLPHNNPESEEAEDKLCDFVYRYTKTVEDGNTFYELLGDMTYAECKRAFRAGFIAGAYPLQGDPTQEGVR